MPFDRTAPDDEPQEEIWGEETHGEIADRMDEIWSPDAELSEEPDEPGESALTRHTPTGGVEPRVVSDRADPPLAEQMARGLNPTGSWQSFQDGRRTSAAE